MNIEIANRLVEMRKEKGLSQEALAAELGISRQAVSKWERAESSPDTSNLITLAKLYNISLDELLNTDQEKFESGEADEGKGLFHKLESGEKEKPDYVSVGWRGVHVKDGEDEVHVGWNGVHIIEDGKETVRVGKGYDWEAEEEWKGYDGFGVWIDGEPHHTGWKLSAIFSLVMTGVYFWIGFEYSLWHPGWLLFLLIPIFSTFVQAIKNKNIRIFAYPVLVLLAFLYMWLVAGSNGHPEWLIFFTIPIYYWIIDGLRDRKKKRDEH